MLAKELRVMSRQRRYYYLRMAYLLVLVCLMSLVWMSKVPSFVRVNQQMLERMAEAGKAIVASIAWFQFVSLQVVTILIMSNAMNEEISHRTLPALMTTPIDDLQIVLGKLFGKGVPLVLLFSVSIPLVALVRIFGAVPWSYVISSFCMTVCQLWFVGTLTLFFSILFKRAYTVMVFSLLALASLFGLLPLGLSVALGQYGAYGSRYSSHSELWKTLHSIVLHISPYRAFRHHTNGMLSPSSIRTTVPFSWWMQCIYILLLSLPVLWLSVYLIRHAALRHLNPKKNRQEEKEHKHAQEKILYRPLFLHEWIRQNIGTGMIWKEFLMPVLGRFRFVVYAASLVFVVLFFLGLLIGIVFERIELIGFIFVFGIVSFFILAILFTVIVPASSITAEKEARSWTVLMTTTLSESRILGGKLAGILRRIVLAWSPFVIIFGLLAYTLHMPVLIAVQLFVITTIALAFLISLGIYISTRFRRTNSAVITNMVVVGICWIGLPLLASFLWGMRYDWAWVTQWPFLEGLLLTARNMTPPGLIMDLLAQSQGTRSIWHYSSVSNFSMTLKYMVLYSIATLFFFWRAHANLRRHLV